MAGDGEALSSETNVKSGANGPEQTGISNQQVRQKAQRHHQRPEINQASSASHPGVAPSLCGGPDFPLLSHFV